MMNKKKLILLWEYIFYYKKMTDKKGIVVLPVVGKPYIAIDRDETILKDRQDIVGGCYERIRPDIFMIHPMFVAECPRWGAVNELMKKLKKNQYEIICNDNGGNTECPNMACLLSVPSVLPVFGIIGIITKEKYLEGLGLPYKKFLEDEDETDEEESDFNDEEQHYLVCK